MCSVVLIHSLHGNVCSSACAKDTGGGGLRNEKEKRPTARTEIFATGPKEASRHGSTEVNKIPPGRDVVRAHLSL